MKNIYDIIKFPVVTEKSTKISENNQFVFKVGINTSKDEIKNAVEKLFKVKVKAVNTIKVKGKKKYLKGLEQKELIIRRLLLHS